MLAALAASQVLWAVGHVAVASLFRDRLINRLGEHRYAAAFAVTSLSWFLGNTLLLEWIEPGAPFFVGPASLGVVETVVRLAGYLLLLTLLWAQPSPMDIAAQRTRRLARRNEGRRLTSADFDPSSAEPARAVGLTKIVRHPQFFGFGLLLSSLLLGEVTAAEVAYAAPALALIVVGLGFQERRMRSEATVRDFLDQTSNIPGWALVAGRTRLSRRELGELGRHAAIPAAVVGGLVVIGQLGGDTARQALTPDYSQAAWFLLFYTAVLALQELVATITGRYLRAT
ncbi:MAG: NnrU family protein [Panacagrimonas sp.]